MMDAAILELAHSVNLKDNNNRLLPEVSQLQEVSRNIGIAVAKQAILEGMAKNKTYEDVGELVDSNIWEPAYVPDKPSDNFSS